MISTDTGQAGAAAPPLSKTLLLHPADTVVTCIAPIARGDTLVIDDRTLPAPEPVQVGHKLARHSLKPGDKVVKWGAPIGSLTGAVAPGGHVHSHNMKSDYIPSHSRQSSKGSHRYE